MYKAVGYMDYTEMFRARLTQLRLEKGVSARDMSLSLGQSESYINKIENSRAMPSMSGFFYCACDYLGITPQDFFNTSLRRRARSAASAPLYQDSQRRRRNTFSQ